MAAKDILFPIGRLIGGSVTRGDSTDSKGQPRVVKTGANAGQPLTIYSFGVAFPKNGTTAWTQTPWGASIYQAGVEGYPNGETNRPDFSWKVIDGDSQIPNKKGKKPCDQNGYPGNWIVWFASAAAPKLYDIIGNPAGAPPRPLIAPMEILPGYYVQVFGSAKDNKPSDTPGVYVNHSMVALAGYGEVISYGPDANEVGFGGAPLPTGASTVPVGGMTATTGAAIAAAPLPGAVVPPPGVQQMVVPAAAVITPVAVTPNPAILAQVAPPPPPAAAAAAAPPPPPPAADPMGAPPGRRMIGAYTYQQLHQANYSDEQMIAQGYMQ
jgi:hypothetical protein